MTEIPFKDVDEEEMNRAIDVINGYLEAKISKDDESKRFRLLGASVIIGGDGNYEDLVADIQDEAPNVYDELVEINEGVCKTLDDV